MTTEHLLYSAIIGLATVAGHASVAIFRRLARMETNIAVIKHHLGITDNNPEGV